MTQGRLEFCSTSCDPPLSNHNAQQKPLDFLCSEGKGREDINILHYSLISCVTVDGYACSVQVPRRLAALAVGDPRGLSPITGTAG